ncbi:inositol monophosphatase family protein [Anditalea andensis]|uniref:Inositol-1-monophosphatase n=1 Tax=Anditalea andensis TaxID=1048983 RepID=A0A074L000_9BACT|nr:inositol monophosphatase family protein [Anditalea andensis]KEO73173.1 inositol-1-monophosphatase [Anditalea andensis]
MDLDELMDSTISIAKKAGAFIRNERQGFQIESIEHKGFNDLVSYVDKEAEKMIVEGLKALLPEAGYITEEGTETVQNDVYNWIIDPLDGTTNFIHGLPIYSVSIALIEKDKLLLGVVYEINLDECFYAISGRGAFCNGKSIKVSSATKLADSLIATGFPYYDFDLISKYLEVMKNLMQKSHGIRRLGSAAVDLVYVACGRAEAFFEYNLNAYDVAAGALIVLEAGGHVTDFGGGDKYIFGRQILASNFKIHSELMLELKDFSNKEHD